MEWGMGFIVAVILVVLAGLILYVFDNPITSHGKKYPPHCGPGSMKCADPACVECYPTNRGLRSRRRSDSPSKFDIWCPCAGDNPTDLSMFCLGKGRTERVIFQVAEMAEVDGQTPTAMCVHCGRVYAVPHNASAG